MPTRLSSTPLPYADCLELGCFLPPKTAAPSLASHRAESPESSPRASQLLPLPLLHSAASAPPQFAPSAQGQLTQVSSQL